MDSVQDARPNLCDREWQRRLEKRTTAVQIVKMRPLYVQALGTPGARPLTPDPGDRSCSKRTWEHRYVEWKKALVEYVRGEDGAQAE